MANNTSALSRLLRGNIFILLLSVMAGIGLGSCVPEGWMQIVLLLKQLSGQVIFFLVPLIILGFVAPSIASLSGSVTRTVLFAFLLAYLSSVLAATMAASVAYAVVPHLHIATAGEGARALPELVFSLDIPPVMSVMSALLLALLLGLGVIWTRSDDIASLLKQFQTIVLALVKKVLVPVLPVFIATNFCALTYAGQVAQLKVFLPVILIAIACHYVWLLVLYVAASLYSRRNGWHVLRHYLPAYLTALGTMSSAATLGVALDCIHRSTIVPRKVSDFTIPLFANIHLCGSVLTEVLFACVVSQLLYGHLPAPYTLAAFILLLGIFAIGAPGVPGGTVMASLGIVVSVLGFDEAGTALIITIFALQDSFGTACNITGDGALTLIVSGRAAQRPAPAP